MIKMDDLINSVDYEKQWRDEELAIILKIIGTEKSDEILKILTKYLVPAIYAIWEGFIKETLVHYSSFINRNPNFEKDIVLITQIIDHKEILKTRYKSFNDKKDTLNNINRIFKSPLMPEERPESKILNFKNSNDLLEKYNLKNIDRKHHSKLNKLETVRNSIAHGEITVVSSKKDINEYVSLVRELMDEIYLNIISIKEQE